MSSSTSRSRSVSRASADGAPARTIFDEPGLAGALEAGLVGVAVSTLLLMLALTLSPWTLRLAVEAVSRLPIRSSAWRIAGATARLRAAASTTMTFPFALAMSSVGVMVGAGGVVGDAVEAAEMTVLFGPVFAVCWVGGVASIAMLATSGARPATVAATTLLEGVVHAVSAFAFAVVLTVAAIAITALDVGVNPLLALLHGPWALLGGGFALSLATCVAAVAGPAGAEGRRPAVERLRVA